MTSLLKRLPSFRRSSSSSHNAPSGSVVASDPAHEPSPSSPSTIAVSESLGSLSLDDYIDGMPLAEMKGFLVKACTEHAVVREALEKWQKERPQTMRPELRSYTSMNKKRRAESELDRTEDMQASEESGVGTSHVPTGATTETSGSKEVEDAGPITVVRPQGTNESIPNAEAEEVVIPTESASDETTSDPASNTLDKVAVSDNL